MKNNKLVLFMAIVICVLLGYIFLPQKTKDHDKKLLDSAMMVDPVSKQCVPPVKLTAVQVTEKSLNKVGLSLSNTFSVSVKK